MSVNGEFSGWILDFDGTLVEIENHPDQVRLPPERLHWLFELARREPVWICTGRSLADLEKILDQVCSSLLPAPEWRERLGCIGSHGLEWRFPLSTWQNHFPQLQFSPELKSSEEKRVKTRVTSAWWNWRQDREPRLRELLREAGLWLEEKSISWTVHSIQKETVSDSTHLSGFPIATRRALESLEDARVGILYGKRVANFVERGHSKGRAVQELILTQIRGLRQFRVIGDEETDETVFRLGTVDSRIYGIKVGQGETAARERVSDVEAVWRLIQDRSSG